MSLALTTVVCANLCDSNGNAINDATIFWQPVTSEGDATSFQIGGGGQVSSAPVSAQVVAGAFTVILADTALTTPVNIGYAVTVLDNESGRSLLGDGYECVQPTGMTWQFDAFVPDLAPNVTVQLGPRGQGFNFKGMWYPGAQYALYDVVFYNGSSYVLLSPLAPAASFEPDAWEILAGSSLSSIVLVGIDDGLHYSLSVVAGAVTVQVVDPSVSGATSLLFIDAATGLAMKLFISSGNVQVIAATATLPAPAVLVDTSSGQHYSLSEDGAGNLHVTPVSSGLAGVSSIIFLDRTDGTPQSMTITGGSPVITQLAGNVAGIGFLYFVDPVTQGTYELSIVSGAPTVTNLGPSGTGASVSAAVQVVLVDGTSGQHFALTEFGGDISVTPVSSSYVGVNSIVLLDRTDNTPHSVTISSGDVLVTPVPGNVAGVASVTFVDPLTQESYILSIVSGNAVVTAL